MVEVFTVEAGAAEDRIAAVEAVAPIAVAGEAVRTTSRKFLSLQPMPGTR